MPRTAISATTMDSLPVDEALPRLKETLAGHNAAVLVAPPGAPPMTAERIKAILDEEE